MKRSVSWTSFGIEFFPFLQVGRRSEMLFEHISNQVMEETAKQKQRENEVNPPKLQICRYELFHPL